MFPPVIPLNSLISSSETLLKYLLTNNRMSLILNGSIISESSSGEIPISQIINGFDLVFKFM